MDSSINILVSNENSNKTKVFRNNHFPFGSGAFAFDWIYDYVFFDYLSDIVVTKIDETNIFYSISNKKSKEYYVRDICVNPIDLFVIWSEINLNVMRAKE
jgi:hypothetical protein